MKRIKFELGDWHIGTVNVVLAGVQALIWLQTASRGLDYVQPRSPMPTPRILLSIEAALPISVWGAGFLIAAFLIFIGVSGRWWPVIVVGHGAGAVLYFCFTVGSWIEVPIRSVVIALAGVVLLAGGCYLAAITHRLDKTRFFVSILLTVTGGWAAGIGMGYDFRTTTGFMVMCASHVLFSVGILWLASRPELAAKKLAAAAAVE